MYKDVCAYMRIYVYWKIEPVGFDARRPIPDVPELFLASRRREGRGAPPRARIRCRVASRGGGEAKEDAGGGGHLPLPPHITRRRWAVRGCAVTSGPRLCPPNDPRSTNFMSDGLF